VKKGLLDLISDGAYAGVSKNSGMVVGLYWKALLKFMIWGTPTFGITHVTYNEYDVFLQSYGLFFCWL